MLAQGGLISHSLCPRCAQQTPRRRVHTCTERFANHRRPLNLWTSSAAVGSSGSAQWQRPPSLRVVRRASDAADAGEQRQVVNALGTTTISGKPERIVVASDFTDLEFLLSLGVHPVAYGNTGAWDRGALPWQSTAGIADLESFDTTGEISPEIIARYSPDLIIGMKTYLEPAAERLSQIAPVIALDWTTSWRDGVATVGQAAFVDEAAAAAIARTDALISDTAASLNGLGGKTIMIGSMYGDQLYVQGDASAPGVLLRELGLDYRGYNAEQMTALSMEQAEGTRTRRHFAQPRF